MFLEKKKKEVAENLEASAKSSEAENDIVAKKAGQVEFENEAPDENACQGKSY